MTGQITEIRDPEGVCTRYEYDILGRRSRIYNNDGLEVRYGYDALSRIRHIRYGNGVETAYTYDGDGNIRTLETREQKIRYIRTHELVASDAKNARTYYHYAADEMGSITHVIDGECVLNHYTYDTWGVPTVCKETVENRFRFNGQQYDPVSRQYYMRARFYNPVIARFTQEDSYRGDGLNLYSYCENNPVYYIDPSGHYVCASGVKRRTEDVRRRTATRDEYKSLSSHLREKLRNGKPLTPSEKAAAENLGINVNRKGSTSGKKTISYTDYDKIYQSSIHNTGKEKVMLGKYDGGGATSYITKAGDDYTYFSLGNEWSTIKAKYGYTDNDMFKLFNEAFLDDGINAGKTFQFSHNPIDDAGALGQEYQYLLKNNYKWDDESMTMKPRY